MGKPLSMEDKKFDNLKKTWGFVYKLNGRYMVFSWEQRPRHRQLFAITPLDFTGGKTISEAVIAANKILRTGGKIKMKLGKKPPQPKSPVFENPVVITGPVKVEYGHKDYGRVKEVEYADEIDISILFDLE